MATYGISGIWKDENDVITHYAIHTREDKSNSYSRAEKVSKARAIGLAEGRGNTLFTWDWSYETAGFTIGQRVEVVSKRSGKYLRSNADDSLTDNLGHLLDFDWISQ